MDLEAEPFVAGSERGDSSDEGGLRCEASALGAAPRGRRAARGALATASVALLLLGAVALSQRLASSPAAGQASVVGTAGGLGDVSLFELEQANSSEPEDTNSSEVEDMNTTNASDSTSAEPEETTSAAPEETTSADPSVPADITGPIYWAWHPYQCLDVRDGKTSNGNQLQLWGCVPEPDQVTANKRFLVPADGEGKIKWAESPTTCVAVEGGCTKEGTRVVLWDCNDAAMQENMVFTLPLTGAGVIRWTKNPHICLDVKDGQVANGAEVQTWSCNTVMSVHHHKQFYTPNACTAAPKEGPIQWKPYPNRCVGVLGNAAAAGTPAVTLDCPSQQATTDPNEQWLVPACGVGQVKWKANPAFCLHVQGGVKADGTAVDLHACDDAAEVLNMEWSIPPFLGGGEAPWTAPEGAIRWKRFPWKCLDVRDGQLTPGAHMQIWGCQVPENHVTVNKRFIVPAA